MKKLRNLIAVMAMMSMAAVLTGCGDDDDEDDDDDQGGGVNIVAPLDEATLTSQNRTYTVNVAGEAEPITLTFPAAGQYRIVQEGATEEGTISGAARNENTWTLNVTPNENQEGSQAGVLTMVFSSPTEGAFSFQPTGGGTADTGTFTVALGNGGTDGSTDGGNNGGTTSGTGNAPASLDGRRIQLQTTGAGQELLTFSGATSGTFTSDINPGTGGTFTYTATGTTATLQIQYDTPAAFANDFSDLTLTFANDTSGTFSGNQHYEGQDHNTTGNFSMP